MNTDDLIKSLSADLKPVRPMASPYRMVALFGAVGAALIGMSFFIMKARGDLSQQLSRPTFFLELGISFLFSISAMALAAFLSRPGRGDSVRKSEKVMFGFLLLAFFYDISRVAQLDSSEMIQGTGLSGIECFASVLGFSAVLGTAMIFVLRKGASVRPSLSGVAIALGCVAMGNVSIAFFCGVDNGVHALLWHFLFPIAAAVGLSFVASRIFLKW